MATDLSTVRHTIQVDCVSASVDASAEDVVTQLSKILGTTAARGRPLPGLGYNHAAQLVTEGNICKALVMHGGTHDAPHVYAIGREAYDSPAVYEALQERFRGLWGPSRIDIALDLWDDGAFDLVVPQFIAYATRHDITLGQMGDWVRGKARTLYVGAKASRSLIRVYEFNACHGYGAPCRIELQLRPRSKGREHLAQRTPADLLYSSDAINVVLSTLGMDVPSGTPLSPGARPPDDLDRKLNWLAIQALPTMLRVLATVGGDPVGLLEAIMARAREIEAQKVQLREAWPAELRADRQEDGFPRSRETTV